MSSLASKVKTWFPQIVAGFCSMIFLDSLRYKFTNAPETQVIFGKLDAWTSQLGAPGLFAQTGLFSQYVIGSAELLASLFLLIGMIPALRRLQTLGFVVALCVMSGAVSFHLFTPLGIDPNEDGGGLFASAVIIWLTSLTMVIIRRKQVLAIGCGIFHSITGDKK
jgi:hypothetical protein